MLFADAYSIWLRVMKPVAAMRDSAETKFVSVAGLDVSNPVRV